MKYKIDIQNDQLEFDKIHGWGYNAEDVELFTREASKDIVGLVGEIGELANLIKKIDRERLEENKISNLKSARPKMEEELIDSLVYLIRLANAIDIDLSVAYRKKLKKNAVRFSRFLITDDNI